MMNHKLSARYIYTASILYILVVAYSSFSPAWYNWGASRLRVFNKMEVVIIILSMFIILIPAIQQRLLHIYTSSIKKYQQQSTLNRQILLISIIAFLTFSFWYFNQKTYFLGDGYLLLRNLPLINAPIEVFGSYMNEPLSGLIFYAASLFFKAVGVNNYALTTYQWVSIMSGVMTVFFLSKIGKHLFPDLAVRFIFIVGVLSAASSQMFFSYVENYSIGIMLLSFYIYCSVRYLTEKENFIIVTLSFIILMLSHYGMVLTGFSYLFLLYKEFNQKRYRSIAVNLFLLFGTFVSLYLAVYNKYPLLFHYTFKAKSHLLIHSIPGTFEFNYSFLSSFHIIDVTNLLLFVFPFTVVLIPYIVWTIRFRTFFRNDIYLFMSLCAVGTLLFLFGMKSDLGLIRDWDLYTLFLFPTVIGTVFIVIKSSAERSIQHAFIIIFITLMQTIPWIAINASEDLSMKYVLTLPNDTLWSRKSVANMMDELASFYDKKGDVGQALYYSLKYLEYYPSNVRIIGNVARRYFYFKDYKNALPWFEKAVNAKSSDWEVYHELAFIKMEQQNFQSAMTLLEKCVTLIPPSSEPEPNVWEVYYKLAVIRMKQQNYQSAKILLEKCISLNPPSSAPKLSLAFILDKVNKKKDALALYEEVLLKEPENTEALLKAGHLSYQLNKYEQTKSYLSYFLKLSPNNPEFTNIKNLLKSLK